MPQAPRAPRRAPLHPASLAARARGLDRLLGPLFLLAGALLAVGWWLPVMTVRRLVVFAERVSILEGAAALWRAEEYPLWAIVVVFSILFPACKLLLALVLWYGVDARVPALARAIDWLETFGRWSMLDVFVIALIIAAIQISFIDEVTTHAGLYVFAGAVIVSMLGVRRLLVLARRAAAANA